VSTATRPLPPHGSLSRAQAHHCKCGPCRERAAEYARDRYRLIAYGRWQPYVDAEPVRQHVRMLMSHSIGWQRVCALSGVSNGGMSRLLYGDYSRGNGPSKRVRTVTADRVLAIKPSLDAAAPSALVDGTGTRRRLQALIAIGWPQRNLAKELGVDRVTVNDQIHQAMPTYASTARGARDMYDRLWNVDPASRAVASRWIRQARAFAEARGWPPPTAWDDDYIDSPAATPDLGEHVDRYTAIAEDARWLIKEHHYTVPQAAHRLGITSEHLYRAFRARPADLEAAAA
jgi:hypothetical protein